MFVRFSFYLIYYHIVVMNNEYAKPIKIRSNTYDLLKELKRTFGKNSIDSTINKLAREFIFHD